MSSTSTESSLDSFERSPEARDTDTLIGGFPTARLNPAKKEHADILRSIQGNILKSHGRRYVALILFELDSTTEIAGVRKLATYLTTSAYEQYEQARRYTENPTAQELFCSFAVTCSGFRKFSATLAEAELRQEIPPPFEPTGAGDTTHEAFWGGMLNRNKKDSNDDLDQWEDSYKHSIDGVWLLAHANKAVLEVEVKKLEGMLAMHRVAWTNVEYGEGRSHEPFGFKDDISRSGFITSDYHGGYWANMELPQVLLHDPNGRHTGGSFMVLRKLEQNVAAFRKLERSIEGTDEFKAAKEALGVDQAGALLIGRQRNGDPLVSNPKLFNHVWEYVGPKPEDKRGHGGFQLDKQGQRCPFHAHIRKAMPRGVPGKEEIGFEIQKGAQFVRRSAVYDPKGQLEVPFAEPEGEVGLLFMGYMASIENQFIRMTRWFNDPKFPKRTSGRDPLLSRPESRWEFTPEGSMISCAFHTALVTPKGGAYFYAPPMAWINQLH